MLDKLFKPLKKWFLQLAIAIVFIVFFLASFYNYYFYEKVNYGMIFFTSLVFTVFMAIYIDNLTKIFSKNIVKQFKETIKTNIEKSLVVQKEGHRLSELELNNIGTEAIKGLDLIIKKKLELALYYFSLILIFSFILVIFTLFHQAPLDDIIQYIFHGDCKPISTQK